jgi:hypothetical protein
MRKKRSFLFSRNIEENEMIMELLLKASKLKIDTPETGNMVNCISSLIIKFTKKIMNK